LKTAQIIAITAAGVIAYSLLRKSAAAGRLVFFPDKIRSLKFDGLTPVLVAGVLVQNTSNQAFALNSFAGNVFSNNILVGNVGSFAQQIFNANTEKVLLVDIRLLPLGITNDIIKAFQYKNFSFDLKIEAVANVDNLQVPINLNYSIGL